MSALDRQLSRLYSYANLLADQDTRSYFMKTGQLPR